MSFSSEIKLELAKAPDGKRHCRLALLASLTSFSGTLRRGDAPVLLWHTDNEAAAALLARLVHRLYGKEPEMHKEKRSRGGDSLTLTLPFSQCPEAFADLFGPDGQQALSLLTFARKECCVRACLRGAFLAGGTLSDPHRFYHFEISCKSESLAEEVQELIARLGIKAGIVTRKGTFVVYVKGSEGISDLLGYMGATKGMLEMENARIIREMRGNVNRKVNCETANIHKTANASARQIEDILLISEKSGIDSLPNGLDETARLRIEYPECSLQELGQLHDPPIGKSGVNHRLRRISAIAGKMRNS